MHPGKSEYNVYANETQLPCVYPYSVNLSAVSRKKILKALASDIDPMTNAPLFPAAICSRFASGNVVMFNHLEANNLYTIAKRELEKKDEDHD